MSRPLPKTATPRLRTAVITITHARDKHLHRQRRGLIANAPDLHVIVGMHKHPHLSVIPGTPTTLTAHLPSASSALPLAAARNLGASLALNHNADLLIFLDVDCIPGPHLISRYQDAEASLRNHRALLCGPVAYLPPPPPEGYPDHGLDRLAPTHPARPAPPDGQLQLDDRFELFWSLSFAVSAQTWRELGGFCTDYAGYGAEDTDFGLQAAHAGATLAWVGGANAYHQFHPPSRDSPARQQEMIHNAHLFHQRHGWFPMAEWFTTLAESGIVDFQPNQGLLRARPQPHEGAGVSDLV